jgi:hypothetical protein
MTIVRSRYTERQPLRAGDLSADQDYHIAMRRRHNIGQHGWGIVHGLELRVAAGEIRLRPGMAIDGYGRELIVPEPVALLQQRNIFEACGSDIVDVWLIYVRVAETPLAPGRSPYGPGQHTRWREEARLLLKGVSPDFVVAPRCPVEVDAADDPCGPQEIEPYDPPDDPCESQEIDPNALSRRWPVDLGCAVEPHETPSDDPARQWPVYLGRVKQQPTDQEEEQPAFTYSIISRRRPYATLVGELIESPPVRPPRPESPNEAQDENTPASLPFGQARIRVGGELAGDPHRFAVGVADDAGTFADRIAVDREGNLSTHGHTTIGSDLIDLAALSREIFTSRAIWPFKPEDFKNPGILVGKLVRAEEPLSIFLRCQLAQATKAQLKQYIEGSAPDGDLLASLALDLNRILLTVWGYEDLLSSLLKPGHVWPLRKDDLSDPAGLLKRLQAHLDADRHALYLFNGLSDSTRDVLFKWQTPAEPSDELLDQLILDLNRLLVGVELPGGLHIGGPDERSPDVEVPVDATLRYYAGILFDPPLAPPPAARPWQVYRSDSIEQEQHSGQLRVELLNPATEGDPPRQLFVIGAWTAAGEPGAFSPCLSVGADCTVTAYSHLRVEGQVVESPIDANIDDQRFIAMQTAQRSIEAVDMTSIDVLIDSVTITKNGDKKVLTYNVNLKSDSNARITDIEVYESLIVAGKTERLNAPLIFEPNYLDPTQEVTIKSIFPIPDAASGAIHIVITIIGVGAAFNLVFASKTEQTTIP